MRGRLQVEDRCIFCGEKANTREHVVPRCFLDKPYPKDLPTLPSCHVCNNSFSEDEQYLMYLIDFLKSVEENQGESIRAKVEKTYRHSSSLEDRMFESIKIDEDESVFFAIETNRVVRVLVKIAHCLMVYRYCRDFNMDAFSTMYRFMPQLSESDQQRVKNEFSVQFQTGRFAYKIYSEHEVAMLFSEFLVVHVTI